MAATATQQQRHARLPPTLAPRGLSRTEAAAYIGVSPSKWDRMVQDRDMPAPKRLGGRVVWDRMAIDRAFEALPDEGGQVSDNPWD